MNRYLFLVNVLSGARTLEPSSQDISAWVPVPPLASNDNVHVVTAFKSLYKVVDGLSNISQESAPTHASTAASMAEESSANVFASWMYSNGMSTGVPFDK